MVPQRNGSELIDRFQTSRDPGLREEIILNHLPLVHFVLGRLGLSQSSGADYEDAVSQGLIGLIEAVDNYNPTHGAQFSTYATLRVRGRVLDHLRLMDWLTRGARRRARAVQEAVTHLWGQFGRSPTDDELAAYLNFDQKTLQRALVDASRVILSLESDADLDGEKEGSLHEVIRDEGQSDPADLVAEVDLRARLINALEKLTHRQQILLHLYYYEELTYKEIGAVLDVTESRVCQLHSRAVMDLRGLLARETSPIAGKQDSQRGIPLTMESSFTVLESGMK